VRSGARPSAYPAQGYSGLLRLCREPSRIRDSHRPRGDVGSGPVLSLSATNITRASHLRQRLG